MKKRPVISFSIDSNQKASIDVYAKIKGFDKSSNLARAALFNYIARNRLTERQRATAKDELERIRNKH